MSTHHPNTGISSVFKSITKSFKQSSTHAAHSPSKTSTINTTKRVPVLINPTIVGIGVSGGGSDVVQELQSLLQQLQPNNGVSNSTKVSTMERVIECVAKYNVSSSLAEIWYFVRDYANPTNSSGSSRLRRSTLKLLVECVKNDKGGSSSSGNVGSGNGVIGTRSNYFNDVIRYCKHTISKNMDPDFDLFLETVSVLTDNGINVHDFLIYDDDKRRLDGFLEASLSVMSSSARKYKFESEERDAELKSTDDEFSNLIELLEYVKNCLRYNYTTLNESLVNSIIYYVTKIGNVTMNKSILYSVVGVLNAMFIFGNFPSDNFGRILKLLSSILGSGIDNSLNDIVWESVMNLTQDETFNLVIKNLCENIANPDLQRYRRNQSQSDYQQHHRQQQYQFPIAPENSPIYSCIGSFQLIHKLHLQNAIEANTTSTINSISIEYNYFKIIRASKVALSYNIPMINTAYLRSMDKLLAKESYFDNFGIRFTDSFEKILPFQMWYSNNCSIYDILKSLKVNNHSDKRYIESICDSLQSLYENHELPTPKDKLISFFLYNSFDIPAGSRLFVLKYYEEEKLCSLLSPFWKDNCLKILNCFYYDYDEGEEQDDAISEVRIKCLEVMLNGLRISNSIFASSDVNYDLIIDIFKRSKRETDESVLNYLIDEVFSYVCLQSPTPVFRQLMGIIIPLYIEKRPVTKPESIYSRSFVSISSQASSTNNSANQTSKKFLETITKGLILVFLKCCIENPERASETFDLLISVAEKCSNSANNSNILLILCKLFVRIRVTKEFYVYVTQPSDMMGLASAFKRDAANTPQLDSYKWSYPEHVSYLREDCFNKPNKKLLLKLNEDNYSEIGKYYIDIRAWIRLALKVMQTFISWECYSYVWGHLCTQLSNMNLFMHCEEEIVELRKVICEQLTLNLPSQLVLPAAVGGSEMTKGDLQVAFVRSLSALIGYHDRFSKFDEDQIVNSLIFGLSSWEKTAIPCINILTVCCYEIPMSIKKYLGLILTKLQTRVTSVYASTHTLEFLMSLIHLPTLTSNFTMEEFKRVFGIAFKYIEYANDAQIRKLQIDSTAPEENISFIQTHGVDAEVEQTPSTQQQQQIGVINILSQYIRMMAYNVIANWFLKINVYDRKKLSSFIVKNLISCQNKSTLLDEQTRGFLDFIVRFTYSNVPLSLIMNSGTTGNYDVEKRETILNRWIIGDCSILSIETDQANGDSNIIIRRPTGMTRLKVQLNGEDAVTKGVVHHPNYFLLQLYDNNMDKKHKPIPIIEDSIVLRALAVLDRIPGVEFHKVGIVYIGKGQTQENEVLRNKVGSKDYQLFLSKIGQLIKLKNNKSVYVGGLDTENDVDGEFTRYWRDKTSQVIFHITTMMNNTEENDLDEDAGEVQRSIDLKKRHIGNNYVNVFFDESDKEFNFNLIKSQFNFLSVVISPYAISKNITIEGDDDNLKKDIKFFKVKTFRRSGVPAIFATCHFKIISQDKLPNFIRNLVILANEFATVWHNNPGTSYTSNWAQRVKQLQTLKKKAQENYQESLKKEEEIKEQQQFTSDYQDKSSNGLMTAQSLFEQLSGSGGVNSGTVPPSTTGNSNALNASGIINSNKEIYNDYTFSPNETLNELYQLVEFNSYTS
ncbi:TSC2 [[Candida] subhashii]|uniref:TSC2 n=1 Tax=[Candida] subhashii TaxID=561895 RepID=A0A8J5QQV2_9ASCO|nr:TSC2 [[Candida] subhashii]KAG7663667.1 TSC2 [[Candida] subhashii]